MRHSDVILSDRRESKDLRTDLPVNVIKVRRFFDSADAPLRMTELGDCAFFNENKAVNSGHIFVVHPFIE